MASNKIVTISLVFGRQESRWKRKGMQSRISSNCLCFIHQSAMPHNRFVLVAITPEFATLP